MGMRVQQRAWHLSTSVSLTKLYLSNRVARVLAPGLDARTTPLSKVFTANPQTIKFKTRAQVLVAMPPSALLRSLFN